MNEKKYEVLDEFENCIASNMGINTALLLMKAYCEKYYREALELTLREMDRFVEPDKE